jgi:hypothetical protein
LGAKGNLGIRVMPKVRKRQALEFGHKQGEIQNNKNLQKKYISIEGGGNSENHQFHTEI